MGNCISETNEDKGIDASKMAAVGQSASTSDAMLGVIGNNDLKQRLILSFSCQ